jgi:hypothetical protein
LTFVVYAQAAIVCAGPFARFTWRFAVRVRGILDDLRQPLECDAESAALHAALVGDAGDYFFFESAEYIRQWIGNCEHARTFERRREILEGFWTGLILDCSHWRFAP